MISNKNAVGRNSPTPGAIPTYFTFSTLSQRNSQNYQRTPTHSASMQSKLIAKKIRNIFVQKINQKVDNRTSFRHI